MFDFVAEKIAEIVIEGRSNDFAEGPINIAEIDWTDWKNHCVHKRIARQMGDEYGTNVGRVGDESRYRDFSC